MTDPNELVNEAFQRWVAVTGTNPDQNSFRIGSGDGHWSDLGLKTFFDELNASRDLDPSGLTSFMLLDGAVRSYAQEMKITATDILNDPAGVEARIAPLRGLRALLADKHVVSMVGEFVDGLRTAADHYGLSADGRAGLEKLLADKLSLAFIRRDALRSLETLEAHQFLQGDGARDEIQHSRGVYEFWNINSLLRAMMAQRTSGVTLCLIRDPAVELFSFFVVAVKTGETITILTDREKVATPDFKFKTRRPDRTFDRRTGRHHFPYQLLDVRVSEDQTRLYTVAKTDLVPTNVTAVEVAKIGDLEAEQFVWLVLLFDLVADRYGTQRHLLPETSYTGEMIVEPHALANGHGTIVKSGQYEPLRVAPLTGADVTHETTADQWEMEAKGHNRWMTDRYASRVPDRVLNPVGDGAIPELTSRVIEVTGVTTITMVDDRERRYDIALKAMDPLAFGTKVSIVRDRLWTARSNQMAVVQSLALKEFDETKAELLEWYRRAVEKNIESLLTHAARGTLILPSIHMDRDATHARGWGSFDRPMITTDVESMTQRHGSSPSKCIPRMSVPWINAYTVSDRVYGDDYGAMLVSGGYNQDFLHCVDDPSMRANVFTEIKPMSPIAIATICGLTSVADLPWQLHHWAQEHPYTGNSILDRIDPEEWLLKNPWDALDFRVFICLSARSLNRRRKALGLSKREWPTKDE